MSDPAPLQRWLAHLEAFDAADARPLADRDEMLAIARELGLDDAALAKAEADAEAARARGQAFLDHGRPADAVAALQRALALAPWRFDVLAALAEARTAAFERTGDATHRAAAEATARDLIEVDPGYGPAYALLNRLDRPMAVPVSPSRGSAGGSQAHGGRLFLALVVIVLLLAGGILALVLTRGAGPAPAPSALPTAAPPVDTPPTAAPTPPPSSAPSAAPPAVTASTAPSAAPAAPRTLPAGEHPLPVKVVEAPALAGLAFSDFGSEIHRADYGVRATLHLRVHNGSQDLVAGLEGQITFYDPQGQVTGRGKLALVNSALPQLRPGDQAFGTAHAHKLPWDTARAEVTFAQVKRGAGAGPWPATTPACLQFVGAAPAEPGIDVRVRSQGEDGLFWRLTGEVTNTAAHAFTQVVFEARFLDDAGQPVVETMITDKETLAASWLPPFEPGEVRLFHVGRIMGREERARVKQVCLAVLQLR